MPPTLVNAGVGVLLGAALLGGAFDRRSLAVVALAAAIPDLDAVASLVVPGATNALLHNVWVPVGVAALLYWETAMRPQSRIRQRYGWRGVRTAWVALASAAVAGIAFDFFSVEAVAILYPVDVRFYEVVGRVVFSTQDGLVQTYVESGPGILPLSSPGTTADYHVATWVNPTPGTDTPPGVERRLDLVEYGWQVVVVAVAAVAATVRFREVA